MSLKVKVTSKGDKTISFEDKIVGTITRFPQPEGFKESSSLFVGGQFVDLVLGDEDAIEKLLSYLKKRQAKIEENYERIGQLTMDMEKVKNPYSVTTLDEKRKQLADETQGLVDFQTKHAFPGWQKELERGVGK